MYQTIVTGTDGSDSARAAVRHAAELAVLCGARLHVVTAVSAAAVSVIPETAYTLQASWLEANVEAARNVLASASSDLAGLDIEVTTDVVTGDPASELLRACEQQGADLLVVGNKGMQGARRFFLGSVANRVAHHAECAVLIVPTT